MIHAFEDWERGLLPAAGGVDDQALKTMAAIRFVSHLVKEHQRPTPEGWTDPRQAEQTARDGASRAAKLVRAVQDGC